MTDEQAELIVLENAHAEAVLDAMRSGDWGRAEYLANRIEELRSQSLEKQKVIA